MANHQGILSTPANAWAGKTVTGLSGVKRLVDQDGYILDGAGQRMAGSDGPMYVDNGGAVYSNGSAFGTINEAGQITKGGNTSISKPTFVATATPTARTVDPATETIEGRLPGILSQNSELMQLAKSNSGQQMNNRGLLDSSLAIGAAQTAVLGAAMPIAGNDAATYANAANLTNQNINNASTFNAEQTNSVAAQNLAANTQKYSTDTNANTNIATANISADTSRTNAILSARTQIEAANIDADTRTNLANIEANYKTLLQTESSAAQIYQQIAKNISDITMSMDLDGPNKQAAIDLQVQNLENGFAILGRIGNLDLSSLLDFNQEWTPATTDQGVGNPSSTPPPETP